jgi:hypothetical protein
MIVISVGPEPLLDRRAQKDFAPLTTVGTAASFSGQAKFVDLWACALRGFVSHTASPTFVLPQWNTVDSDLPNTAAYVWPGDL